MFKTKVFAVPGTGGFLLDLVQSARDNFLDVCVFEEIDLEDVGTWAWRKKEQVPRFLRSSFRETEVPEDCVAVADDSGGNRRLLFRTGQRSRQANPYL
jgi:hypothetical protein